MEVNTSEDIHFLDFAMHNYWHSTSFFPYIFVGEKSAVVDSDGFNYQATGTKRVVFSFGEAEQKEVGRSCDPNIIFIIGNCTSFKYSFVVTFAFVKSLAVSC